MAKRESAKLAPVNELFGPINIQGAPKTKAKPKTQTQTQQIQADNRRSRAKFNRVAGDLRICCQLGHELSNPRGIKSGPAVG